MAERIVFPIDASKMTPDFLTRAVAEMHPGTIVTAARPIEARAFGEGMASTAGRVVLDVEYGGNASAELPPRIVVKISRDYHPPHALYANEVNFYTKLRSGLDIEAPVALGGSFDPETSAFGLILGDLELRSAEFMTVQKRHSLDQVRSVLDALAVLHSSFWQSPRFATDLGWIESHVDGDIYKLFNDPERLPKRITAMVEGEQFKREMVQRLGVSVDDLYRQTRLVQQHQATLPQTLLHGDMHVGNTYAVEGKGGLVDWQLMVRGYFMHDVAYYIMTALDVEDRRKHERDLIRHYLNKMRELGVSEMPSFETAWFEYRLAPAWSVYIGWLPCGVINYGWEIAVLAHLRVMTAYEDLETAKAVSTLV